MIQASRAGIGMLIRMIYEPAIQYSDFIFILTGIILYLIFRPDKYSLGLYLGNKSKKIIILYSIAAATVAFLIISSMIFFSGNSPEGIMMTVKGTVIIPVFEELLFRGFLWNKMDQSGMKEYQICIFITILFGLWHLGYWDIIYYNVSRHDTDVNMNWIMFNKVLVGMAYGLVTGYARIKTKNTYSCMMLHSFLNIFGR